MTRFLALFRPTLKLQHRAERWCQVRAWTGALYWLRSGDVGAREIVRVAYVPIGMSVAEACA